MTSFKIASVPFGYEIRSPQSQLETRIVEVTNQLRTSLKRELEYSSDEMKALQIAKSFFEGMKNPIEEYPQGGKQLKDILQGQKQDFREALQSAGLESVPVAERLLKEWENCLKDIAQTAIYPNPKSTILNTIDKFCKIAVELRKQVRSGVDKKTKSAASLVFASEGKATKRSSKARVIKNT